VFRRNIEIVIKRFTQSLYQMRENRESFIHFLELCATSQFVDGGEKIPEGVRFHICGLTAPYTAIKFLNLHNSLGLTVPTFTDFIQQAISQTKINCTYGYLEILINNKPTKVPLFYSPTLSNSEILSRSRQIVEDIKKVMGIYNSNQSLLGDLVVKLCPSSGVGDRVRGFSVNTGWDTGGTERLIEALGWGGKISCNPRSKFLEEFKNFSAPQSRQHLFSELTEALTINNNHLPVKKVATVSIDTSTTSWKRYYGDYKIDYSYTDHTVKSHVVTVIGIVNGVVVFLDPAGKSLNDIIQYMDLDDFKMAYNGIHTFFEIC